MTWLLVLQIALTCAIVGNGTYLIGNRLERMRTPSGIAEQEILIVRMAYIGDRVDAEARAAADEAALQQIPGVKSVAVVDAVPFSNDGPNDDVTLSPQQPRPSLNVGAYWGKDLLSAFGVRLVSGRGFHPDEFADMAQAVTAMEEGNLQRLMHVTVITQAMAQRLWPGQNALGKTLYLGRNVALQVVGILGQLTRSGSLSRGAAYSVVLPIRMNLSEGGFYVIRCSAADRARVLKASVAKLEQLDPDRVLLQQSAMDRVRNDYFRGDRDMAGLLIAVCLALMVVTALGIVGLASLWVAQRRKQIGIRRALGATRRDILYYFQCENFLLVTFGIALGIVLAYAANTVLRTHYELGRLPFSYLSIGALGLWCLGQLATLAPALRAAGVPPVTATRSV